MYQKNTWDTGELVHAKHGNEGGREISYRGTHCCATNATHGRHVPKNAWNTRKLVHAKHGQGGKKGISYIITEGEREVRKSRETLEKSEKN